jgi:hypothetical protein
MKDKNQRVLSRREFAQRVALLSASASLASAEVVFPSTTHEPSRQTATGGPKLSEAGQAEADSRYQQIVSLYGNRFDDTQKMELKILCAELQPSLEHIRGFALQNGDSPALYLKPIVERDKKSQPATAPAVKKP